MVFITSMLIISGHEASAISASVKSGKHSHVAQADFFPWFANAETISHPVRVKKYYKGWNSAT